MRLPPDAVPRKAWNPYPPSAHKTLLHSFLRAGRLHSAVTESPGSALAGCIFDGPLGRPFERLLESFEGCDLNLKQTGKIAKYNSKLKHLDRISA